MDSLTSRPITASRCGGGRSKAVPRSTPRICKRHWEHHPRTFIAEWPEVVAGGTHSTVPPPIRISSRDATGPQAQTPDRSTATQHRQASRTDAAAADTNGDTQGIAGSIRHRWPQACEPYSVETMKSPPGHVLESATTGECASRWNTARCTECRIRPGHSEPTQEKAQRQDGATRRPAKAVIRSPDNQSTNQHQPPLSGGGWLSPCNVAGATMRDTK